MCRTRGARVEDLVQVGGGEVEVGADGVDEPPVLAADVHDQRLAGLALGVDLQGVDIHAVGDERLGGEPAKDVVAHPGTDRHADAQPCQVDRRVGRPAADVEHQVIDRHELPRGAAGESAGVTWSTTTIPAHATDGRAVEVRHGAWTRRASFSSGEWRVASGESKAVLSEWLSVPAGPESTSHYALRTRQHAATRHSPLSGSDYPARPPPDRHAARRTAGSGIRRAHTLADQLGDLALGEDFAFDRGPR